MKFFYLYRVGARITCYYWSACVRQDIPKMRIEFATCIARWNDVGLGSYIEVPESCVQNVYREMKPRTWPQLWPLPWPGDKK